MNDPLNNVLIVEARFYPEIIAALKQEVITVLTGENIRFESCVVPGAFEIPAAIRFTITEEDRVSEHLKWFRGYIALGCVIRGETSHYDHICNETLRSLQDLVLRYTLALGNGILTVENQEQAWARVKSKGVKAAKACIEMMTLRSTLRKY